MTIFIRCVLVITAIMLMSCATGAGGRIASRSNKEVLNQKIAEAEHLHQQGEVDAAISVLQNFVDTSQYQSTHDEAYELIIMWLLQLKRIEEAKRVASFFLEHHPKSPSTNKIIKLFDEPKKLEEIEQSEPELLEEKSSDNPLDSLLNHKDYILFEAPVKEALENVNKGGQKQSRAHARLATHYFHLGDFKKSLYHISEVTGFHTEVTAALNSLKQEIDSLSEVDFKSIGVLLPLSGSFAPFGKKTLAAISLALGAPVNVTEPITTISKDGISIFIGDSKGDARETEKVLERLIKVHKVPIVVGDITNEPSLLAAQKCQQYGVPMLSLSRHSGVSYVGDYIFMVNASLEQQIERLVEHAMQVEGHKRFAILFPKHNYGMSMSRMFFDEVIKKGGQITGIESYGVHDTSFTAPVKKLVGKYYLSLRPEASACNQNPAVQRKKCRDSIKPIVDFDALFIPDFKLALIIPFLQQEDLLITNDPRAKTELARATKNDNPHYLQLLGASSWNDKATLDKISTHIEGAYFVDSFSFDESEEIKSFVVSFNAQSGQAPSNLEVFAHDAVKLALKLLSATDMPKTRQELRDRIANFSGKVGLLNHISFLKTGELDAPEAGFKIVHGMAERVQKPSA